jgi:hypothetical protein
VIDLYAITDAGGPPLPDVAQLEAVPARQLSAVCAPAHDREVTPEALWRHEHVVEALMHDRDVLPFRYGTRVPDAAAAERVIEDRYDELVERLGFVRGACELAVRVLAGCVASARARETPSARTGTAATDFRAQGGTDLRAQSGTEYLRARAREAAARDDVARRIHEPLSRAARAGLVRAPSLPGEIMRAAYLVDRDGVEPFAGLVSELQDAHREWRLTCTGPWPPYSFAQQ